MSAPNLDSLSRGGEFHARKPGAKPIVHGGASLVPKASSCNLLLERKLTFYSFYQHWHKPGVKVGKDALPEFKAEVYPPGTAPSENVFRPSPEFKAPAPAETDPLNDLPGTTSDFVHKVNKFGKPLYGETSREAHAARPQRRTGVGGHLLPGQVTDTGDGSVERKVRAVAADDERAAEMKGKRGKSGAVEGGLNWPGAESAVPVSADRLTAEL